MGSAIIIVDDELNILRSLKRTLLEENFEVITKTSGEEALKSIKKQ